MIVEQQLHPAETVADLLGDPLPSDWRDARAVEAHQDHLAALAAETAEAAVEWLVRAAELGSGTKRLSDDPTLDGLLDALITLDQGWRSYVHDTQRDDAGSIVYGAAEFSAGPLVAAFVEGSLERLRTHERERGPGDAATCR